MESPDALVASVRAAGARALAAASLSPDGFTRANVAAQVDHIDTWATTLRAQAELGRKPSGTAYTWAEWAAYGAELADGLKALISYADEGSTWRVLKDTFTASVDDVASLVKDTADTAKTLASLPWWAWLLLFLGGGLIAIKVLR